MSDKPIAVLVTAIAVAPLCVLCVLSPAAFVAAGGWFLASLGGFAPLIAAVLAAGGWLAWRILQRRSAAPPPVEDRSAIDIAFASSVIVENGRIWLYYSLKDAELARAEIRRC